MRLVSLTPQDARNTLALLERVTLQTKEVDIFVDLRNRLTMIANGLCIPEPAAGPMPVGTTLPPGVSPPGEPIDVTVTETAADADTNEA